MMKNVSSQGSLLPFTRLVLIVSAVVQLLFGLIGEFSIGLWNGLFWTAPLAPWPPEVAHFAFLNYLGGAVAAAYAVYQDSWPGARVYFAYSASYIAMSMIVSIMTAVTIGVPLIIWLYVLLSVLYLPAVIWAWRQEAARTGRADPVSVGSASH
jgi:hypothetical protein